MYMMGIVLVVQLTEQRDSPVNPVFRGVVDRQFYAEHVVRRMTRR